MLDNHQLLALLSNSLNLPNMGILAEVNLPNMDIVLLLDLPNMGIFVLFNLSNTGIVVESQLPIMAFWLLWIF